METKLNDTNFKQEVLDSGIPVLVDFWAEWCAPCRMVAPVIEEITKEYEGKIKVCKINVDESPQIASEYDIMSIPTLVIFKNGEMADRIVGVTSKSNIESKIKSYI